MFDRLPLLPRGGKGRGEARREVGRGARPGERAIGGRETEREGERRWKK